MNNLFDSFSPANLTQWENQLVKDLKGQSEDLLQRQDAIEEVDYATFQHVDSPSATPSSIWGDKYARGLQKESNSFFNVKNIRVTDAKTANEEAITALNSGANALRFVMEADVELSVLLQNIQLDVIQTRFANPSIQLVQELAQSHTDLLGSHLLIEWDALQIDTYFDAIQSTLTQKQFPVFVANGYAVQQIGANTSQEVGFILTAAHDALCYLMEKGMTVDQAAACIHFQVGVGQKYFFEIAKTRVLRMLWSKIIEGYAPTSECTKNAIILGMTGFINKSIQDPHTNLLRQTTEVASLILGGADAIVCQPHDSYSTAGGTVLASRMALNIPNILVEESYFDKVIDPYAGSYAVEFLSNTIADKAWELFNSYNASNGFTNEANVEGFKSLLVEKQNLRKALFAEGKAKFIGINSFPNPEQVEGTWLSTGSYLGLEFLVYERA